MSIFKGSGVALATPFKRDKNNNIVIDYDSLERMIEYQIENGTDSIIVSGTTGESSTLTDKERLELIKKTLEYVKGRIPVIAGTGSNDTEHAVYLSKNAEKLGVNGLLCVTPYYNKTNQEGLKKYYKRISDSVDVPIIMYNVPSRTGLNLLPETAIKIGETEKNIVAIKEASGITSQANMIANSGVLDVYSGNDDKVFDVMHVGGKGVISVFANIFPKQSHNMVKAYFDGKLMDSLGYQIKSLDVISSLFLDVNPIPLKKALEYMGLCQGIVREPLVELDESKTKRLIKSIEDYGTMKNYS